MPDTDVDAAQDAVDAQTRWGETLDSRAISRLVKWAKRAQNRVEAIIATQAALEARVKALEDRTP
jgi:hypothetical protein